jgi:hypothetical protein
MVKFDPATLNRVGEKLDKVSSEFSQEEHDQLAALLFAASGAIARGLELAPGQVESIDLAGSFKTVLVPLASARATEEVQPFEESKTTSTTVSVGFTFKDDLTLTVQSNGSWGISGGGPSGSGAGSVTTTTTTTKK